MKKYFLVIVTLLFSLLFGPTAQAEGSKRAPGVRKRQVRQHERIREGVKSGELTKDEARTLREKEREIQKEKQAARQDDGKIDAQERKDLQQKENEVSKDIYNEKHDIETRPPAQ